MGRGKSLYSYSRDLSLTYCSLAYFEIRSILTRMLWHFDMELEDESLDWTDQKEYTLWDKPPLWVRLKHRAVEGM